MEYISNLLDWGDSMFSQYTWESLTSATMMYMYAYDLLGPRPQNLGACLEHKPVLAYKDLTNQSGDSNVPEFLIQLKDSVFSSSPNNLQAVPYNNINTYFGIPENDQFIAYWDRVKDRLYKIRHCLNLQGVASHCPFSSRLLTRWHSCGQLPLTMGFLSRPPLHKVPACLYTVST